LRQEGARVDTHPAFCIHNHKNRCAAEMPSTSLFTRGLIAALLIMSSLFLGNYVMFRDKALPAQGDTYVYATVEKPRDAIAPKARAMQPSPSEPPSQRAPAGALETVRLSFSAHMHAEALPASTKVSVFLVKEVGVAPAARVMLFTLPEDDGSTGVVSTLSRAGENGKAAALRALAEGASVNPVPDLDFITPVGAASDGHVVFVAYIRQERLHLKGRQQPANGKWVIFKEVVLSEGLQEAAVRFQLLTALRPTDTRAGSGARVFEPLVQDGGAASWLLRLKMRNEIKALEAGGVKYQNILRRRTKETKTKNKISNTKERAAHATLYHNI
jgi:hypothetical protein